MSHSQHSTVHPRVYTQTHTVSQRGTRRTKGVSYLSHSAISWHILWSSASLGCEVTCVTPLTVTPSRNIAPWEETNEGKQKDELGLNWNTYTQKENILNSTDAFQTAASLLYESLCADITSRNTINPSFLLSSPLVSSSLLPPLFSLFTPMIPFTQTSTNIYVWYLWHSFTSSPILTYFSFDMTFSLSFLPNEPCYLV